MIKKQHALILAIIGTVLTALFFIFFSKPEDPRGQGGNYPLPRAVVSPTPITNTEIDYKKLLIDDSLKRKPSEKMSLSELQKNGKKYIYEFRKVNKSLSSFSNFNITFSDNWELYLLTQSKDNTDGLPIPPKYKIVLINKLSGEAITISQLPNHIFGCNYTGNGSFYCLENALKKLESNMGSSYLHDIRRDLPEISEGSSFKVCVDITKNFDGALNYDNNSLGIDCTYGTEVGLIDIYTYHTGPANELSPEIFEILESIKSVD